MGRLLMPFGASSSPPAGYDATILADSPVGYWPLNESSGTVAHDLSNANNGTYSGSYSLGATGIGDGETGVNFTGGKMTVPDAAPLRIGAGNVSIEAWIDPNSLPSFAVLWDNANRAYSMFLNSGGGGSTQDPAFAGVIFGMSLSPSTIATGNLYYLAVTSTGGSGNCKIYLNGSLAGNSGISAGSSNSSTGVTLCGNPSTGGGLYQGTVAKFAIYNYILTAAQVTAHYAAA